jgi:hypothetical protein
VNHVIVTVTVCCPHYQSPPVEGHNLGQRSNAVAELLQRGVRVQQVSGQTWCKQDAGTVCTGSVDDLGMRKFIMLSDLTQPDFDACVSTLTPSLSWPSGMRIKLSCAMLSHHPKLDHAEGLRRCVSRSNTHEITGHQYSYVLATPPCPTQCCSASPLCVTNRQATKLLPATKPVTCPMPPSPNPYCSPSPVCAHC